MTLLLSPRRPHGGVILMKALALGCPTRLPVTLFPTRNIMQTDGHERCRQPVSSLSSHVVDVIRQATHFSSTSTMLWQFIRTCSMEELLQITTTNEWAMTELLHNLDIMAKTKHELAATIGTGQSIQEKDILWLPYLQTVLKETLRLHPTTPLLVPHAEMDVEICGSPFLSTPKWL